MKYKLKDLIKLPEKRKPINITGYMDKWHFLNRGYNNALDEIANIEVEVNEKKLIEIIKENVSEFYNIPDLNREKTNILICYPEKLAHAIAQNLKEILK